jgi:hypothetical protein
MIPVAIPSKNPPICKKYGSSEGSIGLSIAEPLAVVVRKGTESLLSYSKNPSLPATSNAARKPAGSAQLPSTWAIAPDASVRVVSD